MNRHYLAYLILHCLFLFCVACGEDESGDVTLATAWQYAADFAVASEPGYSVIAPDVVQLSNYGYRMFYGVNELGVGSAFSSDGLTWTVESGARVSNRQIEGEYDYRVSHPWVIQTTDGKWRMYYQSTFNAAGSTNGEVVTRSAISDDGFTFTRESGTRVTTNDSMDLRTAGHGRILRNNDGLYVLLFSGNKSDDFGPSDIMVATSQDGLEFSMVNEALFPECHDPALVQLSDGRWATTVRYMADYSAVAYSSDGLSWTSLEPLTLYDASGNLLEGEAGGLGDPAFITLPDGTIRIYANGNQDWFGGNGGIIGLSPQ